MDKYNDVGFNFFFKMGWKCFYLKWYEDSYLLVMILCFYIIILLKGLLLVKVVMFVELLDGSCLFCYWDFYVGFLCYYFGLIILNDDCCFIDVDGIIYSWCDGEGVLFDEIYIYYVEN